MPRPHAGLIRKRGLRDSNVGTNAEGKQDEARGTHLPSPASLFFRLCFLLPRARPRGRVGRIRGRAYRRHRGAVNSNCPARALGGNGPRQAEMLPQETGPPTLPFLWERGSCRHRPWMQEYLVIKTCSSFFSILQK